MSPPVDPVTWVVAIAAGLTAVGYIFKRVRWLFRTLDTLSMVIDHELNHNGGKSTKDRATQAASASARIESQIVDLSTQVEDLSGLVNQHIIDPDAHGHGPTVAQTPRS